MIAHLCDSLHQETRVNENFLHKNIKDVEMFNHYQGIKPYFRVQDKS
jgi:hypothetical protein